MLEKYAFDFPTQNTFTMNVLDNLLLKHQIKFSFQVVCIWCFNKKVVSRGMGFIKRRNFFLSKISQNFANLPSKNSEQKIYKFSFCLLRLLGALGNTFIMVSNSLEIIKVSAMFAFPCIILANNPAGVRSKIAAVRNLANFAVPVSNVSNVSRSKKRNFIDLALASGSEEVSTKRVKVESMYTRSRLSTKGVCLYFSQFFCFGTCCDSRYL
jgi:hypothetical protein